MREIFIEELIKATIKNKNIFLIVNDLGFGVIEPFIKKFPKNYFNAGISEQSMAGYAAGLAASGKHVFVYSIANFPSIRCAEQIRNDIDYHNLPVTIVSVGSGVSYGSLGYTHHALQDYSVIRSFPNMLIASPGDVMEARACIRYLIKNPQPSYLRLDKSSNFIAHNTIPKVKPGSWLNLNKKNFSAKEAYLTTGPVIDFVKNKYLKGKNKYAFYSLPLWGMRFKKNQYKLIKRFKKIFAVEDHFQDGGFQSWLNESLNKKFCKTNIISKSISSKVVSKVGSKDYLMQFLK